MSPAQHAQHKGIECVQLTLSDSEALESLPAGGSELGNYLCEVGPDSNSVASLR